jgi:hypothetical protein
MIIFQQGAHKTASSFCSQLLRAICERNGYAQSGHETFVHKLARDEDQIRDLPDYAVVKTHQGPGPAVKMLRNGTARAFITFRDPLDCIQSLLDHAAREDGEHAEEFIWLRDDPLKAMELHLEHLSYSLLWMRLPNVFPIYYSQLVTQPDRWIKFMAQRVGLEAEPDDIMTSLGAIRRMNKGHGGRGLALLRGPHATALRTRLRFLYQAGWWTNSTLHGAAIMAPESAGSDNASTQEQGADFDHENA